MSVDVILGFLSALALLGVGLAMAAHRRISEGLTDVEVMNARLDEKVNAIHKRLDKMENRK